MSFPPPPLPTELGDDTPAKNIHPNLHISANKAINDITVFVQDLETRIGSGGGSLTRYYGEGPPVDPILGASPGDEYVDTLTGDLYVLQ